MPRQRQQKRPARKYGVYWTLGAIALASLTLLALRYKQLPSSPVFGQKQTPPKTKQSDASMFAAYGGSLSCKSCHQQEFRAWESSHHALAERPIHLAQEAAALEPPATI